MPSYIDNLTFKELKEIANLFSNPIQPNLEPHTMLNKHCVIRTYSAGVHIGTVKKIDGREILLENAFRLWSWKGAFTLHSVAMNGVDLEESLRSVSVDEIYLTEVIEFIPTTLKARENYEELPIKKS